MDKLARCYKHHLIPLHIIHTGKRWILQEFSLWNADKKGRFLTVLHLWWANYLCFQIHKIIILPLLTYTAQAQRKLSFVTHFFSAKGSSGIGEEACAPCFCATGVHTALAFLREENWNVWAKKTSLSCGFMGSIMLMDLEMGLNIFSLNSQIAHF